MNKHQKGKDLKGSGVYGTNVISEMMSRIESLIITKDMNLLEMDDPFATLKKTGGGGERGGEGGGEGGLSVLNTSICDNLQGSKRVWHLYCIIIDFCCCKYLHAFDLH